MNDERIMILFRYLDQERLCGMHYLVCQFNDCLESGLVLLGNSGDQTSKNFGESGQVFGGSDDFLCGRSFSYSRWHMRDLLEKTLG